MTSCSGNEVRRCRPLLGTFVEIRANGLSVPALTDAVDAAFSAIEVVHRLMSVHDELSEISEINRSAYRRPVCVSVPTFDVLSLGLNIASRSNGAFDFTHGSTLARWGFLPRHLARHHSGDWRDVRLLSKRRVSLNRPLTIDLGGIAKGYAVDSAIKVLQHRRVRSGCVNAGGDLRAFGPGTMTVYLRHPGTPRRPMHPIRLHNTALATSSPCFTRSDRNGNAISHLVSGTGHTAVTRCVSVSVRSRQCCIADALTKVVLNASDNAERLLAEFDAEAIILTP